MKHYGTVKQWAVVAKTCDSCGVHCENKELLAEWLSYSDTVGYFAEEFVDGDRLELDLCEGCKKSLLGAYIKVMPQFDEYDYEVIDSA